MPKIEESNEFKIVKSNDPDRHLVTACVYSPGVPDADSEFMEHSAIEKMAHEFISNGKVRQIDVQHNNKIVKGASVVESFIARASDPDYIEGSWVVTMKIENEDVWQAIKKGEINGFSIEALVTKTPTTLEFDIPPVVQGLTTKTEDHEHTFFVAFDPQGRFCGGRTTVEKGHYHVIKAGSVTERESGHNHRFSFVEQAYNTPEQIETVIKSAAEVGVYPVKEDGTPFDLTVTLNNSTEKQLDTTTVVKEGDECCKTCGREPCECVADPKKDKTKKLDKFKLAVKEAVTETIKALGLQAPTIQKEEPQVPVLKWDSSGTNTTVNYEICHKASNFHMEQATKTFKTYSEILKNALSATDGKEVLLNEAKELLAVSKKHTTAATYAEEVCEAILGNDIVSANTLFDRYAEFNLSI